MSVGPVAWYWKEAESFIEARDIVEADTARFDEMFRAIEFALLTDPMQASWPVDNTNLRVMSTDTAVAFTGVSRVWVFFEVDEVDHCCILRWIEPVVDDDDEPPAITF